MHLPVRRRLCLCLSRRRSQDVAESVSSIDSASSEAHQCSVSLWSPTASREARSHPQNRLAGRGAALLEYWRRTPSPASHCLWLLTLPLLCPSVA